MAKPLKDRSATELDKELITLSKIKAQTFDPHERQELIDRMRAVQLELEKKRG